MTKKKKQSTGLIIAVVMLGILDMAALAVLLAGVLISPAKGETVKAELPADFRENDQEYYDMDMTADYPSAATVSYGGNAIAGDIQDTEDASDTETDAEDNTIDTDEDPYAGFVFPNSDTVIISKAEMKATLTTRSLCRRAVNEIYARHGYQFSKLIKELSDDYLTVPEGSLYPALYKLIEKGYISDYKKPAGKRMIRVYYHLEASGEERLAYLKNEFYETNRSIEKILDYDFPVES